MVGSRGLRGVDRLLLGSVATKVAKSAPCPVLVARPKRYGAIRRSPMIEPPCKACLTARTMRSEQIGGALDTQTSDDCRYTFTPTAASFRCESATARFWARPARPYRGSAEERQV